MRINLINARKEKRFKQSDVATLLNMTTRQYQRIEAGHIQGKIETWDALEDLFGIPQRQLRVTKHNPNTNPTLYAN